MDRDGEQLFDGEPTLLATHRPGRPAAELELEGPDQVDAEAVRGIADLARDGLAALVEGAFDGAGSFDGERILGRSVQVVAPSGSLDV